MAARARERERINTVASVVEEYIQRHAMPNQRSWRDTRRRLGRDLVQLYGDRPINEIDRADIIRMLDRCTRPRGRDRRQPIARPYEAVFQLVRRAWAYRDIARRQCAEASQGGEPRSRFV